jgi:hypothetical protein
MRLVSLLPFLALFATAAHADQACLRMNDVWSWSPLDRSTLIVETRGHNKFKVTLTGVCPAIMQNKLRLELRSNSNSELACLTSNDDVFIQGDIGPQHCLIAKIESYVPDKDGSKPATH